ncbi:MAG TPA: uroporphyrinogen-III C-methyltransferase [Acidobacteriota bacterium]|nr:uroporphyrinogen-III C-methyltransferase [Acidobacteriota bacterium]
MKVVQSSIGKVFLVGAGPGDPDLLTVKASRLLAKAEVVVHDRLIDPRVLELVNPQAEVVSVGKKGGHYDFPQQRIHELLVRRARSGKSVVRLKGGDPYLFGRGGEEALHLLGEGIRFEVVPGVSSAFAVPAGAGIPLTQRRYSSSVAVVTGHQEPESENAVRWDLLAEGAETLVVLMPLQNLRTIVSKLVLHGKSLDTPAAIIQSGTWREQRQIYSTLREIVGKAEREKIGSPAVLIVGKVVELGVLLSGRQAPHSSIDPAAKPGRLTKVAGTAVRKA